MKQHHVGKLVIGWTGTLTTSKYVSDLLPVLQELEKHYEFEFRMISNEHPGYALKSFVFQPWKKDTEIEDLLRFDIGIMPLEDDQWAKGKCGFKALQYMALGIPPIVSPVGVNTDIVQHAANGFVCNTHQEWYKALERLILEPALRQQLGAAARETVVQRYSVLSQTPTFLQLFEEKE
jgi:glycosyltransferase involved in cell wall biosynthesis